MHVLTRKRVTLIEKCRDVLLEVHTVIAAFVLLIFFFFAMEKERNFHKILVTKPFKKTICKTKA